MADHVRSLVPDLSPIAITPFGVDTERIPRPFRLNRWVPP